MPHWLETLNEHRAQAEPPARPADTQESAAGVAPGPDNLVAPPAGAPVSRSVAAAAPPATERQPGTARPQKHQSGGAKAEPATDQRRFWVEHSSLEDEQDRELIREIRLRIYEETRETSAEERERYAVTLARELAGRMPGKARQDHIVTDVLATLNGRLGVIDPLLRDPEITEVLINAPNEVWVEKRGLLLPAQKAISGFGGFRGDPEVRNLAESIAIEVGRKFDWSTPILDARLADGSRVNAVRWPVALRGTCVSIRRFPHMYGFDELVRMGSLPSREQHIDPSFLQSDPFPGDVDVAEFIRWAFARRLNIVVSGSTSAGKTTILNATMELIDRSLRVVVIEDSAELLPPGDLHVVRFERRPANVQGEGELGLVQLLRAALRQRPDIIIVGECRTTETAVMIEAMTTGHPGSLTTVHAESPTDALVRMTRMVRPDFPVTPSAELREYITSAIQLVFQFRREAGTKGGRRLIERVSAVEGLDERGNFVVNDLYRWRNGYFRPTGHIPAWAGAV